MKKLSILNLLLILCFNVQSQVIQFNDSAMHGGRIRGYAKNASCILVATEGGIFKTTNQGQNWTNVTQNFDPISTNCRSIISVGNDFYARAENGVSSNIYKSTDNGANWNALPGTTFWIQAIGKLGTTLYAIGEDMSGVKLYSSTDGSSWFSQAVLSTNQFQGGNTELLSFNAGTMFIHFNDSLFYTSNGTTLTAVALTGLTTNNFGRDDNISGDAFDNLFFQDGDDFYKYNFMTKTWTNISAGKLPTGFGIMEVSVTEHAIFLVAFNNTSGMRIYRSTDQGANFSELTNTGLSFPIISNIIEASVSSFIANALDERIVISSNVGSTWSLATNQYIATDASTLTLSGNALITIREINGVIRSVNQGSNWSSSNTGIPGFSGVAYFVQEIIQVKDTLFAFVRPDPFSEDVSLYKSSNNGVSWTSAPIPAPFNLGHEYTFAGKSDSALFVSYYDVVSSNYALIVTFNNGASWSNANSQNNSEKTFLVGPKNCLFAFRGTQNSWDDFYNVYKANNFGASFTDLNTGGLFNNNLAIKRIIGNDGDKGVAMLDFDAVNNKALVVVRDRNMSNEDKLYLHNMLTNTWSLVTTTGLPSNYYAGCIKYAGNNLWLLATNTGLYKSTNSGVTWTLSHTATGWQRGIQVNSIQKIGNKVFLGTTSNGVWMVDLSSGILSEAKENLIDIYPNPTRGLLNIAIPEFKGNAEVLVYSLDGKEVMKMNSTSSKMQVNIADLPAGSYVVLVNTNSEVYRKVIIHK